MAFDYEELHIFRELVRAVENLDDTLREHNHKLDEIKEAILKIE